VSSAFTTFRAGLQATLAAGLTAYDWHAGTPPKGGTIPTSTAVGFVWFDHSEQDSSNKLLEKITCGVRMYVIFEQQFDPEVPDPEPTSATDVEQAASDLQTVLQPTQYGNDPWYFDVETIQSDYDNGFIEAMVSGVRWNDAVVGA
jgi:hypothetical protein